MASVNKVILVGNLERDDALIAEIEYLKRKAA